MKPPVGPTRKAPADRLPAWRRGAKTSHRSESRTIKVSPLEAHSRNFLREMANHHELSNFIWQIADLLRGPYRPPQYERVMLPMTVLRRFDCLLAPTNSKVLAEHDRRKG